MIDDVFRIGRAVGRFVAGAVQGIQRAAARKYPTVDETVAQAEAERRELYERLKRAAAAELPDEVTPVERPSKAPPRGLR